jgi:hypothetical protein
MAGKRGNNSSYDKTTRADASDRVWREQAARPTIRASYDTLQSPQFKDVSVRGRDVARALEFLTEATDDDIFRSAALAIRGYGLDKGGLKASTLRMLRENQRTAEWAAMKVMHQFVEGGTSVLRSARLTATVLGLPGQSLRSTVDNLRKVYPKWLKAINGNLPVPTPPDGSTGRKLRVQLRQVVEGADRTSRISRFPEDAIFDATGFAIVPDNREWRRLVYKGFAVLFGVIELNVGKIPTEKNQDRL